MSSHNNKDHGSLCSILFCFVLNRILGLPIFQGIKKKIKAEILPREGSPGGVESPRGAGLEKLLLRRQGERCVAALSRLYPPRVRGTGSV